MSDSPIIPVAVTDQQQQNVVDSPSQETTVNTPQKKPRRELTEANIARIRARIVVLPYEGFVNMNIAPKVKTFTDETGVLHTFVKTVSDQIDYKTEAGPFVIREEQYKTASGAFITRTERAKIMAGTVLVSDETYSNIPAKSDNEGKAFTFTTSDGHRMILSDGSIGFTMVETGKTGQTLNNKQTGEISRAPIVRYIKMSPRPSVVVSGWWNKVTSAFGSLEFPHKK